MIRSCLLSLCLLAAACAAPPPPVLPAADTALDLARAMRTNSHLKVLSLNGYYDMATPFAGAEYDLKHMQLDKALQANISYRYYESGHMIYIHPESMKGLRRDLLAFYDSATE